MLYWRRCSLSEWRGRGGSTNLVADMTQISACPGKLLWSEYGWAIVTGIYLSEVLVPYSNLNGYSIAMRKKGLIETLVALLAYIITKTDKS